MHDLIIRNNGLPTAFNLMIHSNILHAQDGQFMVVEESCLISSCRWIPPEIRNISIRFTGGLIYSFAYTYADSHREVLSALESADEFDSYLDEQNVLNEFVNYTREKGIARDPAGLNKSKEIINTQLKAYISRNIIGEEGFYPIISQIDNTLLRAIEISKQNLLVENIVLDSINARY